MSLPVRTLPLAALLSLVGCSGAAPDTGGDTDDTDAPAACDAVDAVEVTLTNTRLWYVDGVTVTWSNGAASGECLAEDYDTWHCDAPADGDLTITATHPQYEPTTHLLPATDGCRAGGESVTFAIAAAGEHFAESRMYYQQLIEDDYECEHSWEIYGTNCYITAAFCADGYSAVMVTDILNSGVYDIQDDQTIDNVLVSIGDIPTETSFTMLTDTTLEDWTGSVWTLDTESRFELYDCVPVE